MIPEEARRVLRDGVLLYAAAAGPDAPHLTPMVFVLAEDRLWATTARRSRKVRLWRARPDGGGLVRVGDRAVSFRGRVDLYDLLDPTTWGRSLLRSQLLTRAALGFSRKNARFFAGYARDARRVPFGWTPPGRVFLSIALRDGVLLDLSEGEVLRSWGRLDGGLIGATSFRRGPARPAPDAGVPGDVRDALGDEGRGALALDDAPVLPVRWRRSEEEGAYYAVVPASFLERTGAADRAPATLVLDHLSRWRASRMLGMQLRGEGRVYVPGRLRSGEASLAVRSGATEGDAVVRLRPDRVVWWRGWASGSLGGR
ncbi:MAG TPA: pyridoxamine 5'-phosphate oxidase family protein [Actinomycetota bacterium]